LFSGGTLVWKRQISRGPGGLLWFTEIDAGRISRTGQIIEFPLAHVKDGLAGITLGPDGTLYFTEYAGRIGRISPSGRLHMFPVPTAQSTPNVITQGLGGTLWFIEFTANKIGMLTHAILGESLRHVRQFLMHAALLPPRV